MEKRRLLILRYLFTVLVLLHAGNLFAQAKNTAPPMQNVQLCFKHLAGAALLQSGATYTNAWGEPFRVRAFKYYISNIQLQYANGTQYNSNLPPRLVNEGDSTSKKIAFAAPKGAIAAIRFIIGVDSITNTAGVQTGDLDPAKGMYWVWNTGYIMAKLEGTSPAANMPGRQFTYDVGGYKKGEAAMRQISLPVPADKMSSTPATFTITADVLKWFKGAHRVKIAEQPICHEPGARAMQLADNYAQMFAVE